MKSFENKIVVITGAASGMGRAYALAFAKENSQLALCDFDEQGLKETMALVGEYSKRKVSHKVFDISDESATFAFAQQVKEELGDAHVIINNAGIEGSSKPVWVSDASFFKKVMDVNYFGVVNGTRAFLPQLMANDRGVIVNVSSIFGLIGTPNHADYCASKFAVRGFTEALMVELSESNISVHLLHPGGINTNIAQQDYSKALSKHFLTTSPDDIANYLIKSIKKGKLRIVYGNQAMRTWILSTLLPLKLINKLVWSQVKAIIERSHYDPKNKP